MAAMAGTTLVPLLVLLFLTFPPSLCTQRGAWDLLKHSIGISAMHVALLPDDKLVIFDRTDFGTSNISLALGRCRDDVNDQALTHDCSAHSVQFDPSSLAVRPLTVLTDTWCSSGHVTLDGSLVQTGGFNDGDRVIRRFTPCGDGSCDWHELPDGLAVRRWYATNHILPDGETAVVIGGRRQFSYEFVPKRTPTETVFDLRFLKDTHDPQSENNLYPFVHLNTDGNLFIFANMKSILLDYNNNKIVKTFPDMPGGASRSYPCTGSSVLLPLRLDQPAIDADVMVCGGASPEAYVKANTSSVFEPASSSCGRLRITADKPEWEMMEMPMGRVMGDMVLLPNGDVLIINGAGKGTAGWGLGRDPVLTPVLYHVGATHEDELIGTFEVMNPTSTPRMYHSTAHLLSDGRVMVGGSNTNVKYEFRGVLFPTELSVEAFRPPYMDVGGDTRPRIVGPAKGLMYGRNVTVGFEVGGEVDGGDVTVTMVAAAFATHSFSMGQRVVVVRVAEVRGVEGGGYEVDGVAPERAVLAPPGYYMLFVLVRGVPSTGVWVQLS